MQQSRPLARQVLSADPVERRAGPRRAARLGVTVYSPDSTDVAHSLDVGAGGVRLETPHRLVPGALPTLVVPLPEGAVMAVAEVLEASEDGVGWVCRLAFRGLRPADARRLSAFVAAPDRARDPVRPAPS